MNRLRLWLFDHRAFAAALMALALCLRLVIPQGFMPGSADGATTFTVRLCVDGLDHGSLAIPLSRTETPGKAAPDRTAKAFLACPFASLATPMATGTDGFALAPVIVHAPTIRDAVLTVPALPRHAYRIPPARGPPVLA